MGLVERLMDWLKENVRSAQPRPGEGNRNLGLVRQEKLSRIEGESPSRLNMHDNTKT